jgi:hypothetical protein
VLVGGVGQCLLPRVHQERGSASSVRIARHGQVSLIQTKQGYRIALGGDDDAGVRDVVNVAPFA